MYELGVDLLHPGVVKVLVQIFLDLVPGRLSFDAGGVAGQGGRTHHHVHAHEHHQAPGNDRAQADGQFLDPGGQRGIEDLEPGHRRKAPEEAVQQVDAAAQVEGDLAVIPEYGAEDELGKNAAQVFIGAAQQGTGHKQPAGTLVLVAVHEQGHQGNGQAPHDGEGTPHQAGTAHPFPGGDAAEDGLGHITQKSTDDKEQEQLVEAAALGKDGAFFFFGTHEVGLGISLDHTAFGAAQHPHAHIQGEGCQPVMDRPGLGKAVADIRQGQDGAQAVQGQQGQQYPDDHMTGQGGQQVEDLQQQRRQPFDGHQAQRAPEYRGRQADVAVQVEFTVGVIPPAGVAEPFQDVPADPFHRRGNNGAEQEEEEPAGGGQFVEAHGDDAARHAVDQAQRAAQHAAVLIAVPSHSGEQDFGQPADEGVAEKQPDKIVKCHT